MADERMVLMDSTDPAIIIVTLNRAAKRNALSIALMEQLIAALREAEKSNRARVLILRGAGPAFCAGLDLAESQDIGARRRAAKTLAEFYRTLAESRLVTIAAAQGAVMGGGVGLLLACDLAVAAEDVRLGFPEVRRGLVAALVTAFARRHVPDRRLREWVLLGMTIMVKEAAESGLINRIVSADHLITESRHLAAEAMKGAPRAGAYQRLLDACAPRPIAEELQRALAYHISNDACEAAEIAEGFAAFLERRDPKWTV